MRLFVLLMAMLLMLLAGSNFNCVYAVAATDASNANANANATELNTLLNHLKTMQADFIQTVSDNQGRQIQKVYGKMALDRPGKFRWEVQKPIPQLIIANQQRIWIYDPDLEQVTIRKLQKTSSDSPGLLLSHTNAVVSKDYAIKTIIKKNQPDWQYFQLTPIRRDGMFVKIVMGFKHKQISEMSLMDHLGHTTLIEFNSPILNAALPQSTFTFKSPSQQIDVIDETKSKS